MLFFYLQNIISVMALRQSCLYDAPHFFRRDWLLDDGSTEFIESRPCAEPNGVASNEDQPFGQGRPLALQPAQQRRSIEIRHPDVAYNWRRSRLIKATRAGMA